MSTASDRCSSGIRTFVLFLLVLFVGLGGRLTAGQKAPAHAEKQRCASCRRSAPLKRQGLVRQFAEIEVALSDLLTLADLRSLPKAPGSALEVLDGGKRARAQLEAVTVGDLLDKGVPLTVRRDFMLVEGSTKAMTAGWLDGGGRDLLGAVGGGRQRYGLRHFRRRLEL